MASWDRPPNKRACTQSVEALATKPDFFRTHKSTLMAKKSADALHLCLCKDNCNSKVESPPYPAFKHKVSKVSVWVGGSHSPCWVGWQDDEATFEALLRIYAKNKDLRRGTIIHDDILRRGLLDKCSDALVTMYAKCGALAKAVELFDIHKSRDISTWNAIIAGYAQKGQGQDALDCFKQMKHLGLSPNVVTFTCILKACGTIGAVDKGEQIHDEIAKEGLLGNDVVLGSALVSMYAKCGALTKAQQVLKELPVRNAISWNALITGYAQHGKGEQALICFETMQSEGTSPDAVTFICVLKACGSIGAVVKGEQIHDEIAKQGLLGKDMVLGTALVDMYAKCGALSKARRVLEEVPVRNVISWSALIAGYVQHGEGEQALHCFEEMQREGFSPDFVTFICVLKACGTIGATDKGEKIYHQIAKQRLLQNDVVIRNALVDMYAKCGDLTKARQVLEEVPIRNVISWSSLIAGYVQQGEGQQALECFEQMQGEGFCADAVTFLCILKACGSIGAADKGEKVHDEIVKQGLLENDIVLGNALVDMYAKCGALAKAQRVLEELPIRDVITWSALIAGYAQQSEGEQALKCFEQMQREGISPNAVTFIGILRACGSIGAVDRGEYIHDEIAKQGLLGKDIVLDAALVDMYAKCGALVKAHRVLEELPVQTVISWNALIAGSVLQGEAEQALNYFKQMQCVGLSPDAATLTCILSACSHSCLVDDAQMYFENMTTSYGLKPSLEHYTCMVDLFARAGYLDKAVGLIKRMPSSDSVVWSALLGACWDWGNVNIGRWAFEHAIQVDKNDAAVYVLMANIYAAAGMQEDAENINSMRIENKAWGKPAKGWWIDMFGNFGSNFVVGNTKDAEGNHIYAKLETFSRKMAPESYSDCWHCLSY